MTRGRPDQGKKAIKRKSTSTRATSNKKLNNDFLKTTFTRVQCCLPDPSTVRTPTPDKLNNLEKAGLGKLKIVFNENDKHGKVLETLYRIYPRLREAGGIRLVKAASGGPRSEIKNIDLDYYDIDQLRKKDCIGKQSIIYIQPLHNPLNLSPMTQEEVGII